MSYALAGVGESISFEQFAAAMIQKTLNVSIPIVGIKIGSLIPDTVEQIAIPLVVNELRKKVAQASDLQPGSVDTDSMGLYFAKHICEIALDNGVFFEAYAEPGSTYAEEGIVWNALIGYPNAYGILSTAISNAMEDVMEEQFGIPP